MSNSIRTYINVLSEILAEAKVIQIDHYGKLQNIYKNPSSKETIKLYTEELRKGWMNLDPGEFCALKYIFDQESNNVFIWSAFIWHHAQLAQHLGYDISDVEWGFISSEQEAKKIANLPRS